METKLAEGKTKIIFPHGDSEVLIQSKDEITAFNAARKDLIEGKAKIATMTTSLVFKYLESVGIPTHFVRQHSPTEFIAARCAMIPLEMITRRVATGSFLKRNPGVKEGYRFSPPKVEISFKDDEAGDPFWTEEMVICNNIEIGGVTIGRRELDQMTLITRTVFEVLERAWVTQGCSLIDMKIEFGVTQSGEILLADVVDSDSWRLWPAGDRRLQLDKQFYRDLPEVTADAIAALKRNYEHAAEMLEKILVPPSGRAVCLMGSATDEKFCDKIRQACAKFGFPCLLRVSSAHKGPADTLKIVAEYEGDAVPTVFICVAGRSNGLGPVVSGNTTYPVINCPPITPEYAAQDVWSSLRLPSGLGCTTALSPECAALHAGSILGLQDHVIWSRLRAARTMTAVKLIKQDAMMDKLNQATDASAKPAVENGVHPAK